MLSEEKKEGGNNLTHDFDVLVNDFVERHYLSSEQARQVKQFTKKKKEQFFLDISSKPIKRLIAQGVLPVKQLFYFFEQLAWPFLKDPIVVSLLTKGWLTIGQVVAMPQMIKRFPSYTLALEYLADETIRGLICDGSLTEDAFLQSDQWGTTLEHLKCAEGMIRRRQLSVNHIIRYADVIMQKGGYPVLQFYLTRDPIVGLLAAQHLRVVDVIRYPYETWDVLVMCVEKHRVPADEVRQLLPLIQNLLQYRDALIDALQQQLFSCHVCKWRFPLQVKLDATHRLIAIVKGESSFGELKGVGKKVLHCVNSDLNRHCQLLEGFLSESRAEYSDESPESVSLVPIRRAVTF